MFCTNCGNKLREDDAFCPECGARVKRLSQSDTSVNTKNSLEKTEPINSGDSIQIDFNEDGKAKKIHKFNIGKHLLKSPKVLSVIGISFASLVVVGVVTYLAFGDSTKLSWNKELTDNAIEFTPSRKLELEVLCFDEEEHAIEDIEFSVTGGKISPNGTRVEWELPKLPGKYEIVAKSPSGKKVKKKVEVVKTPIFSNYGMIVEEIDDEVADNDKDGFTNAKEEELGTNPNLFDSDKDGLSDYEEVMIKKTKPLKADTDGDGLKDGTEVELGLDPLKKYSKDDGVKDGKRELEYTIDDEENGIKVEIKGKGDIVETTVDVIENPTLNNIDGVLDELYVLATPIKIENIKVEIKYEEEELKEREIDEEKLVVYKFNEKTKELKSLKSNVNTAQNVVEINVDEALTLLLGDEEKVPKKQKVQVLFTIDNSYSMYTTAQLRAANNPHAENTIADGNDANFERLSLTKRLIMSLDEECEFSIAEFAGNSVNLQDFTTDRTDLNNALESMRSKWNTTETGTNITAALLGGINQFGNNDSDVIKYLILLTDGEETMGNLNGNKSNIIQWANDNNITICVISLTNRRDNNISEIVNATGGLYFSISDASGLDQIYQRITSTINYNYADSDNDNQADSLIYVDSGFTPTVNGFRFQNFGSTRTQGHCYGMAAFSMLYYTGQLPAKMEDTYTEIYGYGGDIYGYDLRFSHFTQGKSLYSYPITSPKLHHFLYNRGVMSNQLEGNGVWRIDPGVYDEIDEICVFEYPDAYPNSNGIKYVENPIFNYDKDIINNYIYGSTDKQLMKALMRLHITQIDDTLVDFCTTPDKAFLELCTNLKNKQPSILTVMNGAHAVNAISILQDSTDKNYFLIQVYDNNYPQEIRYLYMRRTPCFSETVDANGTRYRNKYSYSFVYDENMNGLIDADEETTLSICYPNFGI